MPPETSVAEMETIPAPMEDDRLASPEYTPGTPADDDAILHDPHHGETLDESPVVPTKPSSTDAHMADQLRSPFQSVPAEHDMKNKRKGNHDWSPDQFMTTSIPPPVLSERAIDARLRRVFVKRRDGSMLLDDSWNSMWLDKTPGGGREKLMSIFEKVGYVVERGYLKNNPLSLAINRVQETCDTMLEWDYVSVAFSGASCFWYNPLLKFHGQMGSTYQTKHTLEEKFTKRCRSITERIAEETSEVEGEWLTVADMEKLEFSECLGSENL